MASTLGDMDVAAWRLQGPGTEAASGSIIRDKTTGGNTKNISQRQYSLEKLRHREVSRRRRELKVLPWVDVGAGGLGAGKTSGAGTRGVSLDVVIGVGTGYTNTNGGESSDNRSKVHADCGPAENPSL